MYLGGRAVCGEAGGTAGRGATAPAGRTRMWACGRSLALAFLASAHPSHVGFPRGTSPRSKGCRSTSQPPKFRTSAQNRSPASLEETMRLGDDCCEFARLPRRWSLRGFSIAVGQDNAQRATAGIDGADRQEWRWRLVKPSSLGVLAPRLFIPLEGLRTFLRWVLQDC